MIAVILPVLVIAVAGATDIAWALHNKAILQEAADAAAIAGAKELGLSDAKRENVPAVVKAVVDSYIEQNAVESKSKKNKSPTIIAKVTSEPLQVIVTVEQEFSPWFGADFGFDLKTITVGSIARITGQPNVCVLALDPSANKAISLEHNALVTGRECAVFSNSSHTNAIVAKNSATLKAEFICSRGGKSGGPGNFDPVPLTDCPGFDDPLAARPEPKVDPCVANELKVISSSRTLWPGTYCGGILISDNSDVRLEPGIYVIKDGPLIVSKNSSLTGSGVGFFLTGTGAKIHFAPPTSISLEAPTSGGMAGLLMFESRSQPTSYTHEILSNDARVLLGTLYLSRGELRIDADRPIADQSAYTAIVARVMRLYGGPHLILNTNYDETSVPVPKGIRGTGQPISLVE